MGRRSRIAGLLVLCAAAACRTQPPADPIAADPTLAAAIRATGLLHRPLPTEPDRSYEAERAAATVLSEERLPDTFEIRFANHTGKRAVGPPDDIDYATYGTHTARLSLEGRNLEAWNRLSFKVIPSCGGTDVISMDVSFQAAQGPAKPGYNEPTGAHLIPLVDGRENPCFYEMGELRRDRVDAVVFSVTNRGQSQADSSVYRITDIRLQQVDPDARVLGWEPDGIVVSTTGYAPGTPKNAIVPFPEGRFRVVDAGGRTVFRGRIARDGRGYGTADFTPLDREGTYRVEAGGLVSPAFRIGARLWTDAQWRVLNSIYAQRCGDAVPGIHPECHGDLFCEHGGRRISYGGGWHDAGDLSQQTLQTGDIAFALLEAAAACRTAEPDLAARMEEEARWGLEFVLHCRFGDGWRASSMGLLHWTDNTPGTADDIFTVRKQNLAFDNFLFAGYEAFGALQLDGELAERLRKAAVEDFRFARERFDAYGFEPFIHSWEHSYNTSRSQYMATVSWSASQLYRLTDDPAYAALAADAIRYVLACQQTGPLEPGSPWEGFFWRDTDRLSLVHYNHQSREQVYMQAFLALCRTQPDHPDRSAWENAILLYGNYLKLLADHATAYGMLPSGIYKDDEWKDRDGFTHLHLQAPADAVERYQRQFLAGTPVDSEGRYRLRQFPVWFSVFTGNNAVLLAQGKAAALCGHYLGDERLLQIGRDQLAWMAGKNPFGQSLIYGEGSRYPSMDSFSSGELTGEMPVGIRTLADGDEPYWPRISNACYKELWVVVSGKFLSLVSEYQ